MKVNSFSFVGLASIFMIIIESIFLYICVVNLQSYYSGGTLDFTFNGEQIAQETAAAIYTFFCIFLPIAIFVLIILSIFFFRSRKKSYGEVHQQKGRYIFAIILSFIFGFLIVGLAALLAFVSRNVNAYVYYGHDEPEPPIGIEPPRGGRHHPPQRNSGHSDFHRNDSSNDSSQGHRRR